MRIEQAFKTQLHNVGAYSYHFWTEVMKGLHLEAAQIAFQYQSADAILMNF